MKIYKSSVVSAFYNLALEEYILENFTDQDYLLLWQSKNTVVIGRNQNLPEEINLDYAHKEKVNIVRRSTGGGAVYHDTGNLNFSFISQVQGNSQAAMEHFTRPIVKALKALGLDAEKSGRNDIMANGKKVSGNAQRILARRILHHGTLLFDSDLTVLSKVLKVRPEKFISKSAKSVRSRVGNIKEFMNNNISMDEFSDFLMDYFIEKEKAELLHLTAADEKAIKKIQDEKFLNWDWNYGKSPQCKMRSIQKFPGGFLEVHLNLYKGKIKDCIFYGDFLALRPVEDLAQVLLGLKFEVKEVSSAIDNFIKNKFPLEDYFGSIGKEELLDCIFKAS